MDAPQTEREKSQNIIRRPRVRDPERCRRQEEAQFSHPLQCLVVSELWSRVSSRTKHQTVSKPRFWSVRTLQTIDFVRLHFRKIDFPHSLALHLTARSVRSSVAPAS